ncbi:hypothetical protein DUI87_24557 [Hirundo rustica rustica]|uniref:Uncharacterized protein n=1 Tax=Hirundo rustica rustica TaxID=333673 RepID=A0A3M0JDI0_HIRRU|nr:hypothetical protein DUI87_24557 [Hirundo rustica rustica]
MQVLFGEEFGYDLKSQVEKSTRRVSGKPMQFASLLTNWQPQIGHHFHPPPLLFTEIPGSQPRVHMDHKTLFRHLQPWELSVITCSMVQVETQSDFAQGTSQGSNLPYKPQAQRYSLPLSNLSGPCWGLDPWSSFYHDTNTSHSESTQQCHLACVGSASEGPCQLLMGFSSISLVSLSSSSSLSPFREDYAALPS